MNMCPIPNPKHSAQVVDLSILFCCPREMVDGIHILAFMGTNVSLDSILEYTTKRGANVMKK